jgi:dolichyl-phosphate beta-glucosyltransferase
MNLSIVIPAYNEADRIVRTLSQTLAYLNCRPGPCEVMVVSDGSQDATCQVVSRFADKTRVTVKALEYHPNRGKGYAVRYGMLNACGKRILFMDADYAVPIQEIENAMALLDAGCDIAIGSRALSDSVVHCRQNRPRELSGKLYTWIQNRYLGLAYPDTQCGFKLFTRQAARFLFSRQKLSSVIFDPEILWLAKQHRFRVGQFPVTWSHDENSRIQYDSVAKSLFIFRELYRIKRLHGK